MLHVLKIVVLSQNNEFSRNILNILKDSSQYMPASFLTFDFFANLEKYSAIIKESDIVILDLENIYDEFNTEMSLKLLTTLNSDIIIITSASVGNRSCAIRSLNQGAFHYFLLPVNESEVNAIIEKCSQYIDRFFDNYVMESSSHILEKKLDSISHLFSLRKLADSRFVLEKFFYMVIDSIISVIKCDKCSILFLDEKNGDILVQNNKNKRIYNRGPATLNVIASKAPQIIENIEIDNRFKSIKKKMKYRTNSFLNVPIIIDGKLAAIVNVTDKSDRKEFSVDDLEKIRGICLHIQNFIIENKQDFDFFLANDRNNIIKNINLEKAILKKTLTALDSELAAIKAELEARKNELGTLYSMGKILKTTFSISDLLKMIIEVIERTMECKRASVLWIDNSRGDILVKGRIGKSGREVEDLLVKKRGFVTNYILKEVRPLLYPSADFNADLPLYKNEFELHKNRGYKTNSFIAVPICVKNEVVAVINITDKNSGGAFDREDLKKLEFIADQLSTTIENFKLSENLLEKERISKELEIAHRIQSRLLPKSAVEIPGLEVAVMNFSALEMGGDYYDFAKVSDRYYGICVGDVAGKGIPASLQMMILRTLFRHLSIEKIYPADVVKEINKNVINDLESNSFISFLYCVYDAEERKMILSNAGNCYPAHYSSVTDTVESIEAPGLLLGVSADVSYGTSSFKLSSGDVIALYTDGIFDVVNYKKEMWGETNFLDALKKAAKLGGPEDIVEYIMRQITNFKGTEKQFDDMTLVVIKVK